MSLRTLAAEYRAGQLTRGELAMRVVAIAAEVRAEQLRAELADTPATLRFMTDWLRAVGDGSGMFTSEGTMPLSTSARRAARRLALDLSSPPAPARVRAIAFDRLVGPPHVDVADPSATLGEDRNTFGLRAEAR